MIKINELNILAMLNNKDYKAIEDYIKKEVVNQSITDKSLKARLKAFASLSKKYHKQYIKINPKISGCTIQDNKLCLCDGYKAFEMDFSLDLMPDLQMIPEDVEPMDYNKIMTESKLNKETTINFDNFNLQLKEYKATKNKDLKHFVIDGTFDNDKIYVDILFLDEIHKVIDITKCRIEASTSVAPVYFYSLQDDSKALLLPVRMNE